MKSLRCSALHRDFLANFSIDPCLIYFTMPTQGSMGEPWVEHHNPKTAEPELRGSACCHWAEGAEGKERAPPSEWQWVISLRNRGATVTKAEKNVKRSLWLQLQLPSCLSHHHCGSCDSPGLSLTSHLSNTKSSPPLHLRRHRALLWWQIPSFLSHICGHGLIFLMLASCNTDLRYSQVT